MRVRRQEHAPSGGVGLLPKRAFALNPRGEADNDDDAPALRIPSTDISTSDCCQPAALAAGHTRSRGLSYLVVRSLATNNSRVAAVPNDAPLGADAVVR